MSLKPRLRILRPVAWQGVKSAWLDSGSGERFGQISATNAEVGNNTSLLPGPLGNRQRGQEDLPSAQMEGPLPGSGVQVRLASQR
jgi:hypothetical protein